MKIEQDKIIEIKSRIDIRDLISEYMTLKKSGTSLFGLCPFHNEKTPSFSVNPAKQFFNCFGCGLHGDHFTFLQKIEGLSFPEALHKLAIKTGVSLNQISEKQSIEASKKFDLFKKFYKINSISNKFFIESFQSNEGAVIKFLEERKLSKEVVQDFQLGYALNSWNSLTNYLYNNNVPLKLSSQIGLTKLKPSAAPSSNDPRDYYDTFRNRIVFPIIDTAGKVLGFSCRKLDDDSKEDKNSPKYINSPESVIYKKRDSLYGLNLAYKHISVKDEILLVEGNIDCLAISAIGKKNVVATLGTALTTEHVKRLQRLSRNIIVVFDGDKAGINATEKSFEIFASLGINTVKTLLLPEKSDPDSFIRTNGADAFNKLVETSKFLTEFLIDKTLASKKDPGATEKVELFKKCESYINKIDDPLAKQSYYKHIENTLDLTGINKKIFIEKENKTKIQNLNPKIKNDKTEETLLEIILNFPLLNSPLFNKMLTLEIFELFSTPELKIIGKEFIKTLSNLSFNETSTIKVNENNYHEIISKILITKLNQDNTKKNVYSVFIDLLSKPSSIDPKSINEVLHDCISKIIKRQNEKLVSLAKEKIRKAENAKDDVKTILALDEYQRLVRLENAFPKE